MFVNMVLPTKCRQLCNYCLILFFQLITDILKKIANSCSPWDLCKTWHTGHFRGSSTEGFLLVKISQMSNGEVSSDKNHPLLFKLYTRLGGIQGIVKLKCCSTSFSPRTYADFLGQNACSTRDGGGLTLFRPTDAWLVRSFGRSLVEEVTTERNSLGFRDVCMDGWIQEGAP